MRGYYFNAKFILEKPLTTRLVYVDVRGHVPKTRAPNTLRTRIEENEAANRVEEGDGKISGSGQPLAPLLVIVGRQTQLEQRIQRRGSSGTECGWTDKRTRWSRGVIR